MNRKIYIVDDEPSFTRIVKANLEKTGGYSVLTQNDPLQAIPEVIEFKPDMVFLDVMMPGMEGGELAALIREEPGMADIPIVFMTAIVTKQETGQGMGEIGGNLFLAKPVKLQEMLDTIEEVLGG